MGSLFRIMLACICTTRQELQVRPSRGNYSKQDSSAKGIRQSSPDMPSIHVAYDQIPNEVLISYMLLQKMVQKKEKMAGDDECLKSLPWQRYVSLFLLLMGRQ